MSETQQWLYRIQPVRATMLAEGSTPEEDEITRQHFTYLKQLCEAGTVILAGRTLNTGYSSFGIIIFKAESEAAAWDIVRRRSGSAGPTVPRRVVSLSHRAYGCRQCLI